MNEKIVRFLDMQQPATPCLVVDVDVIRQNYGALAENLPQAEIHYAVKANPAPQILSALVALGSHFDAASYAEVELCLAAGASPAQLSYGNTVKKQSDIAKASKQGIDLFCFDSKPELTKLAEAAPGARVMCRIMMDSGDAQWPLSQKFGCAPGMAIDLLTTAKDMGLHPYGISFHVGSQQINPQQWIAAIEQTASLFAAAADSGIPLKTINLGGGFPANYRDDVPDLARYGDVIMTAMAAQFGNSLPRIIIEPGRGISGDAGVIQSEVVLISRRNDDDEKRWVYLDVGKFGGLPETADELIQYRIRTPHDGGETGPVIIAGPTCDDLDILYKDAAYALPLALQTGDKIEFLSAGAYTSTYASIGFNGFPPLDEYYI
ncbi:MAG: type III PLP-dependent enzyme [Alphaproteobacteria bacterium]|nr:type III PLP-dependent enzyme [Alphaproteobacteria bacterium]